MSAVVRPRVSAVLQLDLRSLEADEVDRSLRALESAPTGSLVQLFVAPGQLFPACLFDLARGIASHVGEIQVQAEPETASRWTYALLNGCGPWDVSGGGHGRGY